MRKKIFLRNPILNISKIPLEKYRPGGDVTFTKKLQRAVFEQFTSRQKWFYIPLLDF